MSNKSTKAVTAYEVDLDGFYSTINQVVVSNHYVDNTHTCFSTLGKAKKYLIASLNSTVNEYKANIKQIKSLK